jgi:hypothetical protein
MDTSAIRLQRDCLNDLVRRAVLHLGECGMSYKDVASNCDMNAGTLYQVMSRPDALPNAIDLANLSRLASANGWDELSDALSAPWKRNRPVLDANLNGETTDEIVQAIEAEGLARFHGERGEHVTAYQYFNRSAALLSRAGLEHLSMAGYPVITDPAQRSLFA